MQTILATILSITAAAAVSLNVMMFPVEISRDPVQPAPIYLPMPQPGTANLDEISFSQPVLGADTVLPLGGTVYTLSGSGVSASATSITLTSLTIPQTGYEILDADVSSTFYITLEPGNRTRQEVASCTTVTQSGSDNTATLSGCTRGLTPFTPYTASSTYRFAHGGGTAVVFSNPPQLYNQFAGKDNDETITGIWSFPEPTTASSTATKNYADGLAIAGAPNGSLTAKGIYEEATKAQTAAGTATDTTGADLIVPNSYHNASSTATTTVPVTNTSGKLDQGFLDLTESFTFTNVNRIVMSTATSTATSTDIFNLLPAGVIQMYAGASTSTPAGWLLADGTSYTTSTYPRLFQVIGYVYGGSASNFNVPNMGGRFVGGASSTLSTTIGATGGSLTANGTASVTATGGVANCGPSGDPCGATGDANNYSWLNSTGASTGTATVTSTPPYIIQNFIIKY